MEPAPDPSKYFGSKDGIRLYNEELAKERQILKKKEEDSQKMVETVRKLKKTVDMFKEGTFVLLDDQDDYIPAGVKGKHERLPQAAVINGEGKIILRDQVLYVKYGKGKNMALIPLNKNGSIFSAMNVNGKRISINTGSVSMYGNRDIIIRGLKVNIEEEVVLDGKTDIYYPSTLYK